MHYSSNPLHNLSSSMRPARISGRVSRGRELKIISSDHPARGATRGFSLIELMVAMGLLSLVLLGGLSIFNTLQQRYAREAGYARESRLFLSEADRLFLTMHDNSRFSARDVATWPPEGERPGLFRLTPIWDNASMLNSHGGIPCRVSAADLSAPGFTMPISCLASAGLTAPELRPLARHDLPTVLIMGAEEGCILEDVTHTGSSITFTVKEDTCLKDSAGNLVPIGPVFSSGIIFPRYLFNGTGSMAQLKSAYFDHPGSQRGGTGLEFAQPGILPSPDAMRYTLTSSRVSDDFTRNWVNLHQFAGRQNFAQVNPLALNSFTISIEVVSGDALLATSAVGEAASSRLHRQFNSVAALDSFLQRLYLRGTSGQATLRLHLGAGERVWMRELQLQYR